MTTIDNLMALADAYAEEKQISVSFYSGGFATTMSAQMEVINKREALRTALTEALAQPVREPLSYEQMRNLSYLPECMNGDYLQVYPFARAIERAHGIGGDK